MKYRGRNNSKERRSPRKNPDWTSALYSAAQDWLQKRAATEYAAQMKQHLKSGRARSTMRYSVPDWHRELVDALGLPDPSTFLALKHKWMAYDVPLAKPKRNPAKMATVSDDKVIDAFLNQKDASSKYLTSTGVRITMKGLGSDCLAEWINGQIKLGHPYGNVTQSYLKKIAKKAPAYLLTPDSWWALPAKTVKLLKAEGRATPYQRNPAGWYASFSEDGQRWYAGPFSMDEAHDHAAYLETLGKSRVSFGQTLPKGGRRLPHVSSIEFVHAHLKRGGWPIPSTSGGYSSLKSYRRSK